MPPPPRPEWRGGSRDEGEVAASWSARVGRVRCHVVLEATGKLSYAVRRLHWTWRADWATCAPGWTPDEAKRAAEVAAEMHPANTERWSRRNDGVLILEETKR